MKKKTILLVDDEEGIRKVLGIYLADMDYRVITRTVFQSFHCFQQVAGAYRVSVQCCCGCGEAEGNTGLGGKMKDSVGLLF